MCQYCLNRQVEELGYVANFRISGSVPVIPSNYQTPLHQTPTHIIIVMNPIFFSSWVLKNPGASDHSPPDAAFVSPSAATRRRPTVNKILRFLSAGFSCWALAAAFMVPNAADAGIKPLPPKQTGAFACAFAT